MNDADRRCPLPPVQRRCRQCARCNRRRRCRGRRADSEFDIRSPRTGPASPLMSTLGGRPAAAPDGCRTAIAASAGSAQPPRDLAPDDALGSRRGRRWPIAAVFVGLRRSCRFVGRVLSAVARHLTDQLRPKQPSTRQPSTCRANAPPTPAPPAAAKNAERAPERRRHRRRLAGADALAPRIGRRARQQHDRQPADSIDAGRRRCHGERSTARKNAAGAARSGARIVYDSGCARRLRDRRAHAAAHGTAADAIDDVQPAAGARVCRRRDIRVLAD